MNLPLIAKKLSGKTLNKELVYDKIGNDEVEDLYELLLEAKMRFPGLEGVVSGAVLSEYQRNRVEHVCARLGLASVSPI